MRLHTDALGAAEEPAASPISAEDREFFEKEVRPLLVKRCFECHGGTKPVAGCLEPARVGERGRERTGDHPGQAGRQPADRRDQLSLSGNAASRQGGKLPAEEIAMLTRWVAMGAADPRAGSDILGGMTREEAQQWWAFQPLPRRSRGRYRCGCHTD